MQINAIQKMIVELKNKSKSLKSKNTIQKLQQQTRRNS